MKKVKYIILNLFLLLQLSIVLIFVMEYITMSLKIIDFQNKSKELFKTENVFTISILPNQFRKLKITNEDLDKFYNFIQNDEDLSMGLYDVGSVQLLDDSKNIKFNFESYLSKNFENSYFNNPDGKNPIISIDKSFTNIYDLKIAEGNKFDFNNLNLDTDYIPVLVGQAYKQKYNLNDLIRTDYKDKVFKIIGFLDYGQYFITDSSNPFLDYLFLDNAIVIPEDFNNITNTNFKLQYIKNSILKYNDGTKKEELKHRVEQYLNECNIEGEVKEYTELKNQFLYAVGVPKVYEMFLYGAVLSCSIVGIATMIIMQITYRKKEIGIKFAVGYTKAHVICSLIRDAAIIITVAYVIALSYYKIYNVNNLFMINVNLQNSIVLFIICFILFVITTIIPISVLIKTKPKDLIGGMQ